MPKIFFETHGCSANFSETEAMMGMLRKNNAGIDPIVSDPNDSDVIVMNLCTVKGENTALKAIRKLKEKHPSKRFVYAGCLTNKLVEQIKARGYEGSLINTNNIHRINEAVYAELRHTHPGNNQLGNAHLKNSQIDDSQFGNSHLEYLAKTEEGIKVNLPRIRRNPVVGIIQILSGCSSFCSFCSVKLIKRRLISYPMEDIIKEAESSVNDGCREIWLTSQDNGAYMAERGISALPKLVRKIARIEGDFKIRIGMLSPKTMKPITEEMIDVYKHEKVFRFLHLPIQSGNNDVLAHMRRGNTVEEFKHIISSFRHEIPDITLSTDIIVGYPTETGECFMDTLRLIKDIRFDVINIARFAPREGTSAALLPQLPGHILKERSRSVTGLFQKTAAEHNKRWLGWEGYILIDEKGKYDGKYDTWIGRNYAYKPVVVRGNFKFVDKIKLGDKVMVKINSAGAYDLRGEVMEGMCVVM